MQIIQTKDAPAPIGAYSQAVMLPNGLVLLSGQIGIDPVSGEMKDGFDAQMQQVFANIKAVLASAHLDTSNVTKLTIFLQDINHFSKVNDAMQEIFKPPFPARSLVQAAKLPKNALIEIEAMAFFAA